MTLTRTNSHRNEHADRIMSIKDEFEALKRTYFPRWDNKRLWRCVKASLPSTGGRCEFTTKIIRISANQQDTQWILVHEICHAVTRRCGHGKAWQQRMLVVAKEARELSNVRLATMLEENVRKTQAALEFMEDDRPSIRTILDILNEAVSFGNEAPTFNRTVAYLAQVFGVSRKELLLTYSEKTLRKEYGRLTRHAKSRDK